MRGSCACQTSKDITNVAAAPMAKSMMPDAWVGTSTSITWPASGPDPTILLGKVRFTDPHTLWAGPRRATSAVK